MPDPKMNQNRDDARRESTARAGWKGAVYQVPSAGLGSSYPPIGRHILYTAITIAIAVVLFLVFAG
ncbi:hypothetical protein [Indioceanicola profundi]|uniref:hypothetical protein n=1 Tax=Indioceanicola profundi TaxID=2220096 RepID=UPI0013C3F66D|nr:hypothetical protein [Indioceanicola profundi]